MARKKYSKKRKAANRLISIALSFLLLVLTIMLAMQAVFFNRSTMLNTINESGYIDEKVKEISNTLIDTNNAIELPSGFYNSVLSNSLIHRDTIKYIENYYEGKGSNVDDTDFKEILNKSLDNYIVRNNIDKNTISESSREQFVNNSADVYRESLIMPLLSDNEAYFLTIKNILPVAMIVLVLLITIICIIIFTTSKWKHRACRYLGYATTTVTIATGIAIITLLVLNITSKLNVSSQSMYKLFTSLENNLTQVLIYFAVFYAIVSIGLYYLHKYYRKKKSSRL